MLRLFGDSISIEAQQYVDNWDAGLLYSFVCQHAVTDRIMLGQYAIYDTFPAFLT